MKIQESYINFTAVTPSDTDPVNCKGIYIGTIPDLGDHDIALSQSVDAVSGVLFKNVTAGQILPIELKNGRILDTDTNVSNIVLLDW